MPIDLSLIRVATLFRPMEDPNAQPRGSTLWVLWRLLAGGRPKFLGASNVSENQRPARVTSKFPKGTEYEKSDIYEVRE